MILWTAKKKGRCDSCSAEYVAEWQSDAGHILIYRPDLGYTGYFPDNGLQLRLFKNWQGGDEADAKKKLEEFKL